MDIFFDGNDHLYCGYGLQRAPLKVEIDYYFYLPKKTDTIYVSNQSIITVYPDIRGSSDIVASEARVTVCHSAGETLLRQKIN